MPSVLIVDDSPTARNVLSAVLTADPAIEVIGCAENGQQAIAMTRALSPDVVTMDINMPVMDGLQATKEIMIETPTPIIIVSSNSRLDEVEWSMQALRAGALTAIKKPIGPGTPDFVPLCKEVVHTVKAMAGIYLIRHRRVPADPVASQSPREPNPNQINPSLRAVGIAASTGGPPALATLLDALPAEFPTPILLVQHIVPSFVSGFVSWLDSVVGLRVKLAIDQEQVEPGTVYVGPPDRHLGMSSPNRLELSDAPAIEGFRPAASYLFDSLARTIGRDIAAVIMTGMGSDGVTGLQRVHEIGGYTIAQDEPSCVVFGMPRAAIAAGVIEATLPLEEIPAALERLADQT